MLASFLAFYLASILIFFLASFLGFIWTFFLTWALQTMQTEIWSSPLSNEGGGRKEKVTLMQSLETLTRQVVNNGWLQPISKIPNMTNRLPQLRKGNEKSPSSSFSHIF